MSDIMPDKEGLSVRGRNVNSIRFAYGMEILVNNTENTNKYGRRYEKIWVKMIWRKRKL